MTAELRAYIEARVEKLPDAPGCWLWTGPAHATGYGHSSPKRGGDRLAHRAAWAAFNGAIPPGMHVLHRCDTPPCCNPSHLFLGTHADNMADRRAKGRYVGHHPHSCRLAIEDYVAIRAACAAGEQMISIARRFGITDKTVRKIRDGHSQAEQHYRFRSHCARGHEYTPENTLIQRKHRNGARVCLRCKRDNTRRWRAAGLDVRGRRPSFGPRAQA